MLFVGSYEHTIDAKNRLAIPADFRSQWDPKVDGTAWFAIPWPGNRIRLYTETTFQELARRYSSSLTPDEDQAELLTTLFGLSRRLEMDSAGRIRFPDDMLSLTGLSGEVTLVGGGDRLEIRDRAAWRKSLQGRLDTLPEQIGKSERKQRELGAG